MMTAAPTKCPPPDQLNAFVLGRLSDEASEAVYQHLSQCESCTSELETIDDGEDSLIVDLRKPDPLASFGEEPDCQVAVVKALGSLALSSDSSGIAANLPQEIGEYEIVRPLGSGGMGSVYLARHRKLGREVALKVLATHRLGDARVHQRFEAEMRAIGRLSHPNIVTAHDAREIEGTAVLVTEYIDGLDLGRLVQAVGPLSTADACEIVRVVCVALAYTHDQGFVHRDIKPSNVMLSRSGEVKLLDLGLARFQYGDPDRVEITGTGQAMGTADYMAPEQVTDSRSVDVRADIYSLGCTLMKLLTGQAPFADDQYQTPFAKMTAHVSAPPPRLSDQAGNVPKGLVSLVDSMLQKDLAKRPQSAVQVAEELEKFTEGSDLQKLIAGAHASGFSAASEPLIDSYPIANAALESTRRRVPIAFAVATGFLGFLIGIAFGVIITIKYPDGTQAKIDVPPGSEIAVESDELAGAETNPKSADATSSVVEAIGKAGQRNAVPQLLNSDSAPVTAGLAFRILLRKDDLTEEELEIATSQLGLPPSAIHMIVSVNHGDWIPIADQATAPIVREHNGIRYALASPKADQRLERTGGHVKASVSSQGLGNQKSDAVATRPEIKLAFDDALTPRMRRFTSDNLGKSLAVVVDGSVVMAPVINSPITSACVISGDFTPVEILKFYRSITAEDRTNAASKPQYSVRGTWNVLLSNGKEVQDVLIVFSNRRYYVLENSAVIQMGGYAFNSTEGVVNGQVVKVNEVFALSEFSFSAPHAGFLESKDGQAILYFEPSLLPLKVRPAFLLHKPGSTSHVTLTRQSDFPAGDNERLELVRSGVFSVAHSVGLDFCQKLDEMEEDNAIKALENQELANRRLVSQYSLKQIGIGFHNFHDVYQKFPGSANVREGARAISGDTTFPYSWRVAILPFVEQQDLFEQYRFNEPWDSENNIKLVEKMPEVYQSPFAPDDDPVGQTHFLGFATEHGALGNAHGESFRNFTDGLASTILLVESKKGVPWTKPEDLTETNVESLEGDILRYLMADGSVHDMQPIDNDKLQKLITRDGGEVIGN
ncbi:Serine/threonine-protein kinase PknB [Roseimaritima multifibrata]|uniref:Serine/threonine-protein kinase PknB n=1 Tax=Roseimaritima multifibrata TaxID=1930274 RepID=A0A517MMA7_9BACT|nr:protein kinase [Roseimaritima multifibrata]QDS96026.1 Serine/threonine-protein kinase PknB [Roseimaritima multifibrata]